MTEQERFARCLAEILRHEGGYSDNPSDPGGATNLGVTKAVLSAHRKRPVSKQEVKALTVAEAGEIYRERYWLEAACDKLPAGVDLMVFDLAVNSGPSRGCKFLQEAVGADPDGKIGPATLRNVEALSADQIVNRISARRERFYRSLNTFPVFGRGWMRRLTDVTAKAREWAA